MRGGASVHGQKERLHRVVRSFLEEDETISFDFGPFQFSMLFHPLNERTRVYQLVQSM